MAILRFYTPRLVNKDQTKMVNTIMPRGLAVTATQKQGTGQQQTQTQVQNQNALGWHDYLFLTVLVMTALFAAFILWRLFRRNRK